MSFSESESPQTSEEKREREEGQSLEVRYDQNGLIAAIVVEHGTDAPLMLAYMNEEALQKTLATGLVHFYSRSRQSLWMKGETSGNVLKLREARIDCDQDALWLAVALESTGAKEGVCHTGRRSCFYRRIDLSGGTRLEWIDS